MTDTITLPTIILASIVLLVGVLGNAVVCYVCGCRLGGSSVLNNFVLSLAVLDLLGCALCLPLELVELSNRPSSSPPALCLTQRFFRILLLVSSLFLLVAIATERYRRICRPHTRPLQLGRCRLIIVAAVIVAVFLSWPSLFLFGEDNGDDNGEERKRKGMMMEWKKEKEEEGKRNVDAVAVGGCGVKTSMRGSLYPVAYFSLLFLLFFLACLLLTSLYAGIALAIWRPRKLRTDARAKSTSLPDCRRLNASQPFAAALGRDVIKAWNQRDVMRTIHKSDVIKKSNVNDSVKSSDHSDVKQEGNVAKSPSERDKIKPVHEQDVTVSQNREGSTKTDANNLVSNKEWLNAGLTGTSRCARDVKNELSDENHYLRTTDVLKTHTDATTVRCEAQPPQGIMTVGRCGLKPNVRSPHFGQSNTLQRNVRRVVAPQGVTLNRDVRNLVRNDASIPQNLYDELTRSLQFRRKRDIVNHALGLSPIPSFRRQRRAAYSRTRTTLIMFLMTLTSLVSYLPYVIVNVIFVASPGLFVHYHGARVHDATDVDSPNTPGTVVTSARSAAALAHNVSAVDDGQVSVAAAVALTVCLKSYLISSALNPVIYGFCNQRFKTECRRLFRACLFWCGRCANSSPDNGGCSGVDDDDDNDFDDDVGGGNGGGSAAAMTAASVNVENTELSSETNPIDS